jgi:hypothetical protein
MAIACLRLVTLRPLPPLLACRACACASPARRPSRRWVNIVVPWLDPLLLGRVAETSCNNGRHRPVWK